MEHPPRFVRMGFDPFSFSHRFRHLKIRKNKLAGFINVSGLRNGSHLNRMSLKMQKVHLDAAVMLPFQGPGRLALDSLVGIWGAYSERVCLAARYPMPNLEPSLGERANSE